MTFTRYEIRKMYWEDREMEYIPFDTLAQAHKYIDTHKDECKSTQHCNCALYKIIMHSDYEQAVRLEDL